jgi:hypothetical protein
MSDNQVSLNLDDENMWLLNARLDVNYLCELIGYIVFFLLKQYFK